MHFLPPSNLLLALSAILTLPSLSLGLLCGRLSTSDIVKVPPYMTTSYVGVTSALANCADTCKATNGQCRGFRYSYKQDTNTASCQFFSVDLNLVVNVLSLVTNLLTSATQYYFYDVACDSLPSLSPDSLLGGGVGSGVGSGTNGILNVANVAGLAGQADVTVTKTVTSVPRTVTVVKTVSTTVVRTPAAAGVSTVPKLLTVFYPQYNTKTLTVNYPFFVTRTALQTITIRV